MDRWMNECMNGWMDVAELLEVGVRSRHLASVLNMYSVYIAFTALCVGLGVR